MPVATVQKSAPFQHNDSLSRLGAGEGWGEGRGASPHPSPLPVDGARGLFGGRCGATMPEQTWI